MSIYAQKCPICPVMPNFIFSKVDMKNYRINTTRNYFKKVDILDIQRVQLLIRGHRVFFENGHNWTFWT